MLYVLVTMGLMAVLGGVFGTTSDAQSMRVEMAPLDDGESYLGALEDAWRKHQPAARIVRAAR